MRAIQLTERLGALAGFVRKGDRIADIGTDHGYIPIYLKQHGVSDYVIAGDINPGPLKKMGENLDKYLSEDREGIIMRLGGGFTVFAKGEVDTVIIAGMGGLLMIEILEAEPEKTRNLKRLILQPRNAPEKLRKWLLDQGYPIVEEILVREGKFIWEIMVAEVPEKMADKAKQKIIKQDRGQYDIGDVLMEKRDPLLLEFLHRKIAVEEAIIRNTRLSESESAFNQRRASEKKLELFRRMEKDVCEQERAD